MSRSGSITAACCTNDGPTAGLIATFATRRTSFTRTPSTSSAPLLRTSAPRSACARVLSCRQYRSNKFGNKAEPSHSNMNISRMRSLFAARFPNTKARRTTRGPTPVWLWRHRTTCWRCARSASKASHRESCKDNLCKTRETFSCNSSLEVYIAEMRVRSAMTPSSMSCCCLSELPSAKFRRSAATWMRSCASFEVPAKIPGLVNASTAGSTLPLMRNLWFSSFMVMFFKTPTANTLRSKEEQASSPEASKAARASMRPSSRKWSSLEPSLLNLNSALVTLRYAAAAPCPPTSCEHPAMARSSKTLRARRSRQMGPAPFRSIRASVARKSLGAWAASPLGAGSRRKSAARSQILAARGAKSGEASDPGGDAPPKPPGGPHALASKASISARTWQSFSPAALLLLLELLPFPLGAGLRRGRSTAPGGLLGFCGPGRLGPAGARPVTATGASSSLPDSSLPGGGTSMHKAKSSAAPPSYSSMGAGVASGASSTPPPRWNSATSSPAAPKLAMSASSSNSNSGSGSSGSSCSGMVVQMSLCCDLSPDLVETVEPEPGDAAKVSRTKRSWSTE
mmetsp:Transcript_1959/g.4687  ORF Transcript_1959/g.4687 Transcript_1959/m.4687 type:complete len:569 (-) Transcript_1959:283-1989(-)